MDLDALGKHQWGHLRWSDLLQFMTESQAKTDIRDGRYIRVLHGVYRVAGLPPSIRHLPMAAYLAIGDPSAVGFRCAAWLSGMPYVPGRVTELLVPYSRAPRLASIRISRTTLLPSTHIERLDALAVTSAARTICDLSARLSRPTVAKILRGAVRHDLTTYEDVWRVRDELRARGRRKTTVIDHVLEGRVPGLLPGDSEGEYQMLEWIAKAGLPLPKQQHWVITDGGRFCLDAAYVEEKIDLEWDSELHERTPDDVEYDAARDSELELYGWLVKRASRLTDPVAFIRWLEKALQKRGA